MARGDDHHAVVDVPDVIRELRDERSWSAVDVESLLHLGPGASTRFGANSFRSLPLSLQRVARAGHGTVSIVDSSSEHVEVAIEESRR